MNQMPKLEKIGNVDADYVVQFLKHVKKLSLAPDTKYAYEQSVNRCVRLLSEGKRETNPTKITESVLEDELMDMNRQTVDAS